jgi:hypothetical protein
MPDPPTYELEFYAEEGGDMPALRWIKEDLSPTKRRPLGMAMNEVLQRHGDVACGSGWAGQAAACGLRTRAQASVTAETITALPSLM